MICTRVLFRTICRISFIMQSSGGGDKTRDGSLEMKDQDHLWRKHHRTKQGQRKRGFTRERRCCLGLRVAHDEHVQRPRRSNDAAVGEVCVKRSFLSRCTQVWHTSRPTHENHFVCLEGSRVTHVLNRVRTHVHIRPVRVRHDTRSSMRSHSISDNDNDNGWNKHAFIHDFH